jgi:hypothetical protein
VEQSQLQVAHVRSGRVNVYSRHVHARLVVEALLAQSVGDSDDHRPGTGGRLGNGDEAMLLDLRLCVGERDPCHQAAEMPRGEVLPLPVVAHLQRHEQLAKAVVHACFERDGHAREHPRESVKLVSVVALDDLEVSLLACLELRQVDGVRDCQRGHLAEVGEDRVRSVTVAVLLEKLGESMVWVVHALGNSFAHRKISGVWGWPAPHARGRGDQSMARKIVVASGCCNA